MFRSVVKMMKAAAKGFTLDARPTDVDIFVFNSPKVVDKWHVFTDAAFGGRSQASLLYNTEHQAAEFSGRVTLEQDEDADMKRAGYCVAASKVTHIGDYFDLSGCTHLALKVMGDGRTYIANVRTDSIAGTGGDVWQAAFKTRPQEWLHLCIPLESLMLTYQGQLVMHRMDFQAHQVISVGVAASALPGAEDQVLGQDTFAQSDSSHANSSNSSSSSSSSNSSSSSSSGGQADQLSSDAATTVVGDVNNTSIPDHGRFRLLIQSIRAEVHPTEE